MWINVFISSDGKLHGWCLTALSAQTGYIVQVLGRIFFSGPEGSGRICAPVQHFYIAV